MNEENQPSIFDDLYDPFAVRRKYLIPKWIRFFCWIFAIVCPFGIAASFIFALAGGNPDISIYGIQTSAILSLAGIAGIVVFVVKGAAAIGILGEKDWAIKAAIADGILGIALCVYGMIFNPWVTTMNYNGFESTHYNLRLEVLLLIPYLVKMIQIRRQWEEDKYAAQAGGR